MIVGYRPMPACVHVQLSVCACIFMIRSNTRAFAVACASTCACKYSCPVAVSCCGTFLTLLGQQFAVQLSPVPFGPSSGFRVPLRSLFARRLIFYSSFSSQAALGVTPDLEKAGCELTRAPCREVSSFHPLTNSCVSCSLWLPPQKRRWHRLRHVVIWL